MTEPLDPQQRLEKFISAYQTLVAIYGYQIEPVAKGGVPVNGLIHLSQMGIDVRAVPNWKAPEAAPHTHEIDTTVALDSTVLEPVQNGARE